MMEEYELRRMIAIGMYNFLVNVDERSAVNFLFPSWIFFIYKMDLNNHDSFRSTVI